MKKWTLSILFYIRKTKLLKTGEAPIYVRITVDGKRAETAINRSTLPRHWNTQRGCARATDSSSAELNEYLDQIRQQIYQYQRELMEKKEQVTAIALRNAFVRKPGEEERMVLQVYQEHNDSMKQMIGKGIAHGTWERHVTSRKHLEDFIRETYHRNDYAFRDIDHAFIVKYDSYLRVKCSCANNSTVKYIRNFGKIIRYALNNDWIRKNPFRSIKFRLEDVNKEFLTQDEMNALIRKKIVIDRIAQVRDVFLFSCFTGLAYIDAKSLCAKDIETGVDGNLWIRKQRHKSKQWAHIPLLPVAREIINRYTYNSTCVKRGVLLPVPSNQKMNAYLKEVADLCGITKNLTTHCARHTFATTVTLANNISMESVSKMLGHSSLNMTKKYARILDTTISREMCQLAQKFNAN
ncbi:MAG TPA: site-specific integrase [Bacteroidales bacterium]|nr:site-specific integrase [Bacteroidales bacterium]